MHYIVCVRLKLDGGELSSLRVAHSLSHQGAAVVLNFAWPGKLILIWPDPCRRATQQITRLGSPEPYRCSVNIYARIALVANCANTERRDQSNIICRV